MIRNMIFVYLIGALGYGGIELLWRGFTHWTMLVLGGFCFLLIYCYTNYFRIPRLKKWPLSAVSITTLEYVCGCIVNLGLGWDVWDYSDLKGNFMGQVCLPFFFLWFLLSVPCSALARLLHGVFRRAKKKRETGTRPPAEK